MRPEAALMLAAVVLIVGVLAAQLVRVALAIRQISATLELVVTTVAAIPPGLAPVPPILLGINDDLRASEALLEDLLARKLDAS